MCLCFEVLFLLICWVYCLAAVSIVTSSAYCNINVVSFIGGRVSLVYMVNNVGERTDPLETPADELNFVENVFLCVIW